VDQAFRHHEFLQIAYEPFRGGYGISIAKHFGGVEINRANTTFYNDRVAAGSLANE
jgi:hypothetical protein